MRIDFYSESVKNKKMCFKVATCQGQGEVIGKSIFRFYTLYKNFRKIDL